MQLDSIEHIVTFGFGAAMVAIYSWTRFDEPSCDSQSEYFARYKPRFSTSYARYARAKWGYVVAIVLLYGVFSLVPELFTTLTALEANGNQSKQFDGAFPLMVALGLITLQKAPMLKDLEGRIRGFLHAFARIPECVRRTVAQMRSSPFNFTANAVASQTRKLNLPPSSSIQQPAILNNLLVEDDLLHTWYSTGCVLRALSEKNRDRTGIDPLFFDFYKDELDSIAAKHAALADLVREYVTEDLEIKGANAFPGAADGNETAASRELRDLRDRLFTFVACGVHSSVKDDTESLEIVAKLGFAVTPITNRHKSIVRPLAGLSLIALMILSILTAYWTQTFSGHVLGRVGPDWINAFPVPTKMPGFFTWSWMTAAFYFTAVFGALAVRNTRILKRRWFDLNNLHRERPILRYVMPTLVGTALGCVTLTIIAVVDGPGFKASFGEVGKAVIQSLPWYPLATVMAFIAVMLADSPLENNGSWRTTLIRALGGAMAMALVGLLMARLSISIGIPQFAAKQGLVAVPDVVNETARYVSLFIAAQIGLLVFVLCIIIQVAERYTAKARCFAGQYIDVITRQGPEFSIFLDEGGVASLLSANRGDVSTAPLLCRGQWQLFPEGTAVKWDAESVEPCCKAGGYGLISSYGDSLIYEGFAEQFSGRADFFAQVRLRTSFKSTAKPFRPAAILSRVGALVSAGSSNALEPAARREPASEKV